MVFIGWVHGYLSCLCLLSFVTRAVLNIGEKKDQTGKEMEQEEEVEEEIEELVGR